MNKRAGRTELRANHIAIAVAAAFGPWSAYGQTPPAPNQMPSVVVTRGDAFVNPADGTYQRIDQASLRAIYEGSMTMGSNAHLHLNHSVHARSGIGLFKDVSGSLSQIFGRISSNGQVFISNPNGVLFGSTARVEVGGLFATTLSTNDNDFMSGAARIPWTNNGASGAVTNHGEIITATGYAALAGPQVRNDGVIVANSGKVALAAGDRVSLDIIGDGLLSISVDQAAFNASVINTGTLQADGGTVMLKASSANALLDTVINTSGIVRANSLVAVNGEIILDGGGAVQVAGTVEAIGGAINVSADSSLNVGSTVCCVPTQVTAGTQTIEAGSITVGGGASVTTTSGSQTVTTPGTLLVRGGVLSGGVGLFHNGSGEQRISAGNLELRGGSGTNTGAFINSNAGGDQVVTVLGALTITGGASGTGNRAGLVSTGAQTINGNPDIVLTGGSGGGSGNASNNVFIQATGPDTKPQTINARSIRLNAGTGTDASATLNAARQVINTIGDVSVFGSGGAGGSNGARIGGIGGTTLGPTNLTLNVGGNLLVHGGRVNGASLGSSGASTQANTITVNAAGNITLESEGAGARIGSSNQAGATPGNISVTAGESLELGSGTAVRANGPITLTAESLTNAGTITNGGGTANANMIFIADAFNLAGGAITAGNAGVFLRPRTGTNSFGIEAAGATTLSNADIASVDTANFLVFGSGTGTNFTGNVLFGENAQVNGGTKNLAFIRSLSPGGTVTIGAHGLVTTGDVILSAGGGSIASNGGRVVGDEMQLRATQGIGTTGARVHTDANALTLGTAGGAFVSEANGVTLRNIVLNVGGNTALNTTTNGTGTLDLDVAGTLNVTAAGTLDATVTSSGGQTITAQSLNISAQDGRTAQILNNGAAGQSITAGNIEIQTAVGGGVAEIRNNAASSQSLTVTGERLKARGLGGGTAAVFSGGAQTINMAGAGPQQISLGDHAAQGRAFISSIGNQAIQGNADVVLIGGSGPIADGSNAIISVLNPLSVQNIQARSITLANSMLGGNNSVAAIQGANQAITTTGDVTLTGNASGGNLAGVRIGGLGGAGATATNVTLNVGGDLVLTGGSVAGNGVGIGSTAALGGPPFENIVVINAQGNVILNSGVAGSGVRIGSPQTGATPGSININAVGDIRLNGVDESATIRTTGTVNLNAASITEGPRGAVIADTLTTTTSGVTNLAGPNEIARFNGTSGGVLTLVDGGTLQVSGITTSNDAITLTTDSLTNTGTITNTGGAPGVANIVLNADAFNLAAGTVEGGAAAVIVRPKTGTNSFGIESAGATTLTNADIASIHTSDFVVFGSGVGTTFTGNMTIGQNAQVNGGGKNLAFFRSSVPGGTATIGGAGVATTGNLIVSGGGGSIVSNGGTVSGDQVQLRASQGIGSSAARVQTHANALAINNTGSQGAFVSEADNVTLRNVNLLVGGMLNNVANFVGAGGAYDVAANGALTVGGPIIAPNGVVNLSANGFGATLSESGGGFIQTGSLTTFSQGATSLTGPNQVQSFNGSTGFDGDLSLNNTGALTITGLSAGGDFALTNSGAVSVTGLSSSFGAMDIATSGGNLSLTSSLSSGGPTTLDIGGTLTLSANGPQTAQLITNNGGQDITAHAVEVVAQNGGFATINNVAGGEQKITVSGSGMSAGLDVHTQASGGFAEIRQQAAGFAQTIAVNGGDHINVNGTGGFATIGAGGVQDISITGTGANAITIGSVGARGGSNIAALHQTVTAGLAGEQGSISIVGPDVASTLAGLVSNPVAGGTQTVSTSGTIRVTGGRAAPQLGNFQSGIFHNGSGLQTINATRIELQGGPSGANNGAFISVLGGGVAANAGAQMINVTGDISIAGGAGGNAAISNLGNRKQTIFADNISLTNSAGGGNNSGGFITGPQQEIHATGNVTLTARASGGDSPGVRIGSSSGATNLELFVDGDLMLTGGTAVNNGVGIGSSGSGTAFANNIHIEAGGSVILKAGDLQNTGVRVGSGSSGTAGGDISIKAGGSIQLNGTQRNASIRTLGNVSLDAVSITETGNGNITAGALTLSSAGDALLTGTNQVGSLSAPTVTGVPPALPRPGVGGNLAFANSGALNVSNLSVGGTLTLSSSGAVAVSNAVTSGGAMNLDVAGDIAVTAGGLQDATLSAFGGQTINARSLAVTSSDGRFASVSNSGGAQSITLSNGAGLDVRTQAFGGFAQVSNDGGSQTISVVNGDHINVNGVGGVAGIYNFGGTQSLSVTGSGANAITLGASGSFGPSQVMGGVQTVTAGTGMQSGSITIVGGNGNSTFTGFSSGQMIDGTQTVSTSGTLRINGGEAPNQPVNGFATGLFHNGSGEQKVSAANLAMQGGSSGLNNVAIIISSGGAGTIAAGDQVIDVGSGNISLTGGSGTAGNTSIIVSFADQTVNAGNVALQGGAGVAGNGAFINTQSGGQHFNVAGELRVSGGTGGGAGINNGSTSPLNTGASQVINAGSVVLEGGAGGSNNGAFINSNFGGDQILTVPGTIRITGGSGGLGNRAGMVTNANQTINGNPDILLTGGSGGGVAGNGNNVFIQATGGDAKSQTINARSVEIRAGAGIDASATFNSARQVITTTGDVSLFGSGGAGTSNGVRIGGIGGSTLGATNLALNVGGDLLLHGGTANGASLGSSGASTQSNNITVTAAGNVTLESEGAGARIGTSGQVPVTSGNIAVTAGGSLQLDKGAIRTLDTVKLDAADISQGPSGLIIAGTLNTTTSGDTTLIGQNEVKVFNATSTGGAISLANTGALDVTAMSAFDNASIDNVGNVTVSGPWSAGGTSLISAQSDIVLASLLASPNVVLQASGSISEFGQNGVGAVAAYTLSTVSGGNTFFSGENRVASYSGTSGGDLFFFNRGDLDVSSLSASMASLSNNGAVTISGPWITSGQTNITAVGGPGATLSESAGGFIQATGFNGLSADGSVNLNGPNRISGNLFGHSMQGNFSLNNAGDLSFGSAAFSGDLNLVNAGALNITSLSGRNVAVTNAGAVTVSGFWNSMGTTAITTTGAGSDLTVSNTVTSQGAMTLNVDGALTVAASGMQVIPPPPPGLPPMPPMPPIPQFASLNSSGGQDITAKSVLVSAHDGAVATVNNQIAGGQTITVSGGGIDVRTSGGTLSGAGSSNAQITNFGPGSQSITVSGPAGVKVGANGGFASITNNTGSSQAIQVTGGTGVDVHAASGFALISNALGAQNLTVSGGKGIDVTSTGGSASIQTSGGAQTVLVTNADHLAVNGIAGQASISTFGGMQTLSITGQGANALTVGSQGAMGTSFIGGFGQVVTAGVPGEQGSIRITGTDAPDRFAGITNNSVQGIAPREQNISVTGTLAVSGGSAAGQFIPPAPRPPVLTTSNAGIFNNANASQIINAGGIEVRGGASGLNNGAFINSGAGGDQAITVNGGVISIGGGDAGSANRAGITSTGSQTIIGNPDILLAGGAGGSANNVFIQAAGSNSLQTIHARTLQMRAGAGIDASATLNGARQVVTTTGDVSLIGSGGAGTLNGVRIGGLGQTLAPTNLTLDVGGSLLLHGGTVSGVSLGSSAASTRSNNITVTAAGNVTLESEGGGARIGTSGQVPVTSGEIVITAGGNVHLGNGTAIRTSDNVSLHADQPGGTISQAANGLILADSLVTSSHGSTSLIGPNQVASFTASSAQGNVQLTNSKPVLTLGSMDLPGNLTVVQTGNLAVGSASAEQSTVVSAAGDISMSASGQILVRGSDTTAGASSAVLAGGELKFSAGNVSLIAGSAPGSFAQITGHAPMDISAGGDVSLMGGSGDGAFARILGYSDINLTVGGFITLGAGTGVDSWARVQTASRDSVITLNFPNLASGGYFVNGIEGLLRDGHTGFLSGTGVAAPGHQLITIYGAP